jgi:hypothetical protein
MGEPVNPADHPDRESLMTAVRGQIEALVAEAHAI